MIQWHLTIDISQDFNRAEKEEISYKELGIIIAHALANLPIFSSKFLERERLKFIEKFSTFPLSLNVHQFDEHLEELFDWGDTELGKNKRACWIKIAG